MASLQLSNPEPSTVAGVPPVPPEKFFVLNTRKAGRLLLLLKIYRDDPNSGMKLEDLLPFGKTLDKVLNWIGHDWLMGKMLLEPRQLLIQLVRDLEKTLPTFDPESTPREANSDIVYTPKK